MKHYPKTFSGRRASQSEYELSSFINLLKDRGVKTYCEIGAREGDTFHEVVKSLDTEYALAVDLPGGLWGKITTQHALKDAIKDLNDNGSHSDVIFGDSQAHEIIEKIHAKGPFDAILIDGDHTIEGVTKDWENYKDLSNIIAFHDIVGTGQAERVSGNKVEVPILWGQLKKEYEHIEFIDKESTMGIGVILK